MLWAAWHLGCLFLAEADQEQALGSFIEARQAADLLGNSTAIALTLRVEALVRQQRDLAAERERHRQAYFLLEQSEREAAERLRFLLLDVPSNLDALLRVHGWASVPLSIKLQPSLPPGQALEAEPERQDGWWARLRELAGLLGRSTPAPAEREPPLLPIPPLPETPGRLATVQPLTVPNPASQALSARPSQPRPIPAPEPEPPPSPAPAAKDEPGPAPTLTIHLLGPFRARLDDRPIENLPHGQVLMLFQYLLINRERPTPREILMETFWPEVSPNSARNSLNVALHNLRKAVNSADENHLVLFHGGGYRINPAFHVWLDAEEFERLYQVGQQARRTGDLNAEAASYEACISLYQGDFLEEEPYEDWPVLVRERLRLAYLEALNRLSQISYTRKQFSASIELSLRLLAADDCREDAHCRLMRCYVQQGQHHLAIRQYQACLKTLEQELGVGPAPATRELYERILRREPV